jgi:hypothetical protein
VLDETGVKDPDGGRHRPRHLSGATVVLCGTGTYDSRKLADIPAVTATLDALADVLVRRCGAPAPRKVADPPTVKALGDAISAAAADAEDVLVVYYVGHGLVDENGSLYLAAKETESGPRSVQHSALPYNAVRSYVLNSPASIKIVILDCCYSGIAVGNLGDDDEIENRAGIHGTYVMTAAARDQAAIATPGEPFTAFTGALIGLLEDGHPSAGPHITLDSAYKFLSWWLPAGEKPRPRSKAIDAPGQFVLADNPAFRAEAPPLPPLPPHRRRVRVPIVAGSALAGLAGVLVLSSRRHGGSWHPPPAGVRGDLLRTWWGLLLLAALLALVVALLAGPAAHWISRHRRVRRARLPLLGLSAFLLTALLAGTALTTGSSARVWLAGCPIAPVVSVLAPSGSAAPAGELAQAYERSTATGNFGCPSAQMLVYSATAPQINSALIGGWGGHEHVQIGPAPDVWLPDWSGEVRQARAGAAQAGRTLPIAESRTVATTPMVLAVPTDSPAPKNVADGTAWPATLTALQTDVWNTVVPDPETAVGGLARVPLYTPKRVKAVERYIDQSYDRGRFPLGADDAALLCAPAGIRARTAYVVTEQDVARFNHNDPLGPSCPQRPDVRLRAVYASDTPILDRQAVRFDWSGATDERTREAIRFVEWLTGPGGQAALTATGLRPSQPAAGVPLGTEWGVQPEVHPRPAVVSVDLVAEVETRYRLTQRSGRVLIAIDASGSMGLNSPGGSLWRVAAQGAGQAWTLVGPRDQLGVWAFQGPGPGGIRKVVPPAVPDPAVRARTVAALTKITPRGPAPLYNAIVAAVAEAGPSTDDRVTAVILLTDGENDNASVLDTGEFRRAVEGKKVRVFAIALGATGCAAPVLKTVTTATAGTCLEADPGTVAGPMATIFEAVL